MVEMPIRFSLHSIRLRAGFVRGWEFQSDCLVKPVGETMGLFISNQFDSGTAGNEWGRLTLDMELPQAGQVLVYACSRDTNRMEGCEGQSVDDFLRDKAVSELEKLQFFRRGSHLRKHGSRDILLYKLKGRYLWFAVMATAPETIWLRGGAVCRDKVNLFHVFPELYRLPSTFLERYLSIFSSAHVDMNRDIEALPDSIDIDKVHSDELEGLLELAHIDGELLRVLTREQILGLLQNLNTIMMKKGTQKCIRQAAELIAGQRCFVAEQALLLQNATEAEEPILKRLYGHTRETFTVLLLQPVEKKNYIQIHTVVNRLKPIQTRANVVVLRMSSVLDGYGYLDCNLRLADHSDSRIEGCGLGQDSFLI